MRHFGIITEEVAKQVLTEATPLYHETDSKENLGYGWLYYGLVRSLKPKNILVIGSGHGFAPVMFALGCKDNGFGMVHFVDPSLCDESTMGICKWSEDQDTKSFFKSFGIEQYITHYKQYNHEYFASSDDAIDLAYIDGSHIYGNVALDFDEASKRLGSGGLILMHDADSPFETVGIWGVRHVIDEAIKSGNWSAVNIPGFMGLSIVQKTGEGYRKTKLAPIFQFVIGALAGIATVVLVRKIRG